MYIHIIIHIHPHTHIGTVFASLPLCGSDEVSVAIDVDGLLDGKRLLKGVALSTNLTLAPHACRFLACKRTSEVAQVDRYSCTDMTLLLSSLAPVLAK